MAAIPASASVATLQPAGITPSEQFGHSVAISGTTIAVGAPTAAPDGVVYVFTQTGGSWSNPPAVATISNPDPAQPPLIGRAFGSSVALAGGQLFVGEDGFADSSVFEFDKPAGGWADTSEPDGDLGAPDTMTDPNSSHRRFGTSIAAYGSSLIVGDPGCPVCGGVNQDQPVPGEAFVYTAQASGWGDVDMPVKTLTQPSGQGDDSEFGSAVGIEGDHAAVGSPTAESAYGAVFVFDASAGNWAQASSEATLTASIDDNTQGGDFGGALAMTPGGIAVGAPSWTFQQQLNGEPVTLTQAGGVWAFDAGAGGRFSSANAIALEAGDSKYESLGTSVGISGRLLVYGSPTPTDLYNGDVLPGTAGGLSESPLGWNGADVSSPNLPYGYCCGANVDDDEFGESVAIAGSTEVVGMPGSSMADIPGAAYVSTGATPKIAIKEPANGSSTSADSAAVSGTIDFPGSLTGVAVDGVAATVTGDDYSATASLKPGKNTITATVTTADGQTASASTTVTSTASPPPPPKQGSPSLPSQIQQVAANGTSSIEISCSRAGACSGSIVETVGVLGGKAVTARAGKRPRRVVIGRASFKGVAAGKRKAVTIKLNATGRRLLARAHGQLKATITIAYKSGGRSHSRTAKVKLRSTKHSGRR